MKPSKANTKHGDLILKAIPTGFTSKKGNVLKCNFYYPMSFQPIPLALNICM